jgi:hypothetical protein
MGIVAEVSTSGERTRIPGVFQGEKLLNGYGFDLVGRCRKLPWGALRVEV